VRARRAKPYSRVAGGTSGRPSRMQGRLRLAGTVTPGRGAGGRQRARGAWGHSHASMPQTLAAPGVGATGAARGVRRDDCERSDGSDARSNCRQRSRAQHRLAGAGSGRGRRVGSGAPSQVARGRVRWRAGPPAAPARPSAQRPPARHRRGRRPSSRPRGRRVRAVRRTRTRSAARMSNGWASRSRSQGPAAGQQLEGLAQDVLGSVVAWRTLTADTATPPARATAASTELGDERDLIARPCASTSAARVSTTLGTAASTAGDRRSPTSRSATPTLITTAAGAAPQSSRASATRPDGSRWCDHADPASHASSTRRTSTEPGSRSALSVESTPAARRGSRRARARA